MRPIFSQAWTVLWAQYRAYLNYSPASRAALATALTLIWYLMWLAGAAFAGLVLSNPDNEPVLEALPTALLLMFLYWQVIPLMMASTGASLDLHKLKIYPIPPSRLFGIEVLLRATASAEMLLILAGASVGLLWNPSIPNLTALAAVPFLMFNLVLSLGTRDVVVRLLSRRRIREIGAIIFVMLAAVPQILLRNRDTAVERWYKSLSFPDIPPIMPWTATANLIRGEGVALAIFVMMAWCLIAGYFAFAQFRRMLAFDAEAAVAAGDRAPGRVSIMDRFYRLPSILLPDPVGAMVEKEIRYLVRSPRFRLVFLMGCTFGLVVARTLIRAGSGGEDYWGPNYLTGASVYSLLLLGEVCFWNSFGFDRSAAQIYFLAPVTFTRALIAKNITAAVFVSLEVLLAAAVCLAMRIPIAPLNLLEAFAVAGMSGLLLLIVGNFLSVRNARGVNSQSSMRTSAPGRTQGLLLLIYPAAFIPAALAYFARWMFHSHLAFYAVLAVLTMMAGVAYKIGLESAARDAYDRREAMIAALSQGQGPITN